MSLIFWTYYVISGCIMAIYIYRKHDKIITQYPMLDIVSKDLLAFIQFITGFFQFPIFVFLQIKIIVLDFQIWRLKIGIRRNQKAICDNLLKKYEECFIQKENVNDTDTYIGIIDKKKSSLHEIKLNNLYHSVDNLSGQSGRYAYCDFYVLTKEKHYCTCNGDSLEKKLQDGWEIILTFNNPNKKQ